MNLPSWNDMSDLNKGAALKHLWKREWEGASYAVERYPCRYWDDPRLTALTPREASRHAAIMGRYVETLSEDEYDRLCKLAANEPDRRCLWAARSGECNLYPVPTREYAVQLLTVFWPENDGRERAAGREVDTSWRALLARDVPGGEWREVPINATAGNQPNPDAR